METPTHHSDTVFDESLYAIDWNEIENTERDYENLLSDIENFFRDDFENETSDE